MPINDWSLSYKKAVQAFPKLSATATKYLQYVIGGLGVLGFLDAIYLTILHYKNAIPPCALSGCETVLTSSYATIAGVPISLLGALYYLAVVFFIGLLLSFTLSQRYIWRISTLLVVFTGLGLLIGLGLVYIQAFVLHSLCQYCLASEVIDFLLFDCSWWLWRKNSI